jgi:dihydrofolate reductase
MELSIVAAVAKNGVIGCEGKIPWFKLEEWRDMKRADMKHFKELTWGHPAIMGRVTYESIGKPLPYRKNIVVSSRQLDLPESVIAMPSPEKARRIASCYDKEIAFVIGGAKLYEWGISLADSMHITEVHEKFNGDVLFPEFDLLEWKIKRKDLGKYSFVDYERRT